MRISCSCGEPAPAFTGAGQSFQSQRMASGKISVAWLAVVAAVAPVVIDFVAGEVEGAFHLLVGHPPVAAVDVLVGAAVLEEDADRLRLVLADQGRIDVAAAQADVGADRAEDAAERVGPFPGGGERDNLRRCWRRRCARSLPLCESWIGRRRRWFSLRPRGAFSRAGTGRNCRPDPVVLEAAIEPIEGLLNGRSVHDEDADGHRHLLPFDQLVEDGRRVEAEPSCPT